MDDAVRLQFAATEVAGLRALEGADARLRQRRDELRLWQARRLAATHADLLTQAKGGKTGDTVLVVIQLSGGNDGLNMVVPYSSKRYYELRPTIGLTEDKVLKINNDIGFHPSMTGLAELYQQKKVAVIQNVGYQIGRAHV